MIGNPEVFPWSPYPMFSTEVWTKFTLDKSVKMTTPNSVVSKGFVVYSKPEIRCGGGLGLTDKEIAEAIISGSIG